MVRDDVPKFPGPLTLFPSREKWKKSVTVLGTFTVIGLVMMFNAAPWGIFVTAVFGAATLWCVIRQLTGAGSLRLDKNGFEVINYFRTQRYRWSEVSDFGTWTLLFNSMVVFKAAKSHLSILEKMSAGLAGGRNGYLPDMYEMGVDELVQFMATWRNSAICATRQTGS
jgi:hypothetical protein